MKIDTNTINVLKNFAKINQSIVIDEGNVLKTISSNKTIMAKAKVSTTFPQRFAVYNLDRFLAIASTFVDPDFTFGEKYVKISDDTNETKYYYADENSVVKAPNKEINLPTVDVTFNLKYEHLKQIEKNAGILGLPEINVTSDGKVLYLQAADSKAAVPDVSQIAVGESDKAFKAVFKADNIKILPLDYKVEISSKGISHFVHDDVEYFIAVEQNSVF